MAADEVPWEATLLNEFAGNNKSLKEIGYAVGSVLASTWYIASTNDCSSLSLCGNSLEDQTEIRQWIHFYLTKIKTPFQWQKLPRDQIFNSFEVLNSHLSSRLYMCECGFSLADILLYYGLHRYLLEMSYTEKIQFIHVTRWFDHIQHYRNLKPFLWSWVSCPKNSP